MPGPCVRVRTAPMTGRAGGRASWPAWQPIRRRSERPDDNWRMPSTEDGGRWRRDPWLRIEKTIGKPSTNSCIVSVPLGRWQSRRPARSFDRR